MISGADYISFGSRLAVFQADEAAWRTSISRAYYGVFHHAIRFLDDRLLISCPNSPEVHNVLKNALDFSGVMDLKRAASVLSTLRTMRNKADYQIAETKHGAQRLAMDAVEQANKAKSWVDAVDSIETLRMAQGAISANLQLLAGLRVRNVL